METEFLTSAEALQFVRSCEEEGVFIYGIERFLCVDGKKVPDMNGIADFSSIYPPNIPSAASAARSFMSLFGRDDQERFKLVF